MSNLRIWDQFCRTPADATKQFNKGGWSGTDINPAYRLKCLTELFGPQGTGWGWTIHERWREAWPSRVKVGGQWEDYSAECAFVCLSLWYFDEDGVRHECSPQIGGTECDLAPDEVWKMSITDAIGKCCLALGIAADVYLGQFDSKYREAPERERAPQQERVPTCPKCNSTKGVIKGKEEYGGGWVCYAKKGGCGHKWHDAPATNGHEKPHLSDPAKNADPYHAASDSISKTTTAVELASLIERIGKSAKLSTDDKLKLYGEAKTHLASPQIAANDPATMPLYSQLAELIRGEPQPA